MTRVSEGGTALSLVHVSGNAAIRSLLRDAAPSALSASQTMVGLGEETSNQFLETLADWERQLKQLDTDVLELIGDEFGGPEL